MNEKSLGLVEILIHWCTQTNKQVITINSNRSIYDNESSFLFVAPLQLVGLSMHCLSSELQLSPAVLNLGYIGIRYAVCVGIPTHSH